MSAVVRYVKSEQLAGCDVWLKDGTHVIFVEPGQEGTGTAPVPFTPRSPRTPRPALQAAFDDARERKTVAVR